LSAGIARAAAIRMPPWSDAEIVVGVAIVPMAAAGCAGILAAALQSGGLTFAPIAFKAERLDIASGIKRMASRETVAHSVRAVAAFAIAAAALWTIVTRACALILRANVPEAMAAAAWQGVRGAALSACACGLAFAIAEYASARRAWLRKLRMSFEERKREAKEHEGDPHARGRRRALHRSLLRGSPSEVKNASFVVVNPTHVAVALRYVPEEMAVPVTLVAAAGEAALRVRELAARSNVPIVEDAPLARALFGDALVGLPISKDHYVAVAAVVVALARANAGSLR
jgi:flagellar biosynthesis protein FlhB